MPKSTDQHIDNTAKAESWRMFDRISGRYDLLNRLLSLRIDKSWRKRMICHLPQRAGLTVMDAATGTGDVLLTLAQSAFVRRGIGIDPAQEMLAVGREKIAKLELTDSLTLLPANALDLPVKDNGVDVVTISFGIRNVPDVPRALQEMHRVLNEKGRLMVLEFSLPGNKIIRNMYLLYFRYILPKIGAWISGDAGAYGYLNKSVEDFPYGNAFAKLLFEAGFYKVSVNPLTLGIATLYIADKKK